MSTRLPLIERFPALANIPRVALGRSPTPVAHVASLAPNLWIKRDDLYADPIGGNKTRALEFLLGGVRAGDTIATVGSAGSTHALAVATYGVRLGAQVFVGRWRQEMNDTATTVARRTAHLAQSAPIFRTPVGAYAWAAMHRLRGARWIAAGGSVPLGILGHVNAGLELVAQIENGQMPEPRFVVLPLGTGGTAAGLALAFAIAQRPITVVGARVVPRIVARLRRVRSLADATGEMIERTTGTRLPRVDRSMITIDHQVFGGAYGRATTEGTRATTRARETAALALDATYSAKALGSALRFASNAPTLFWLTFDSRTLDDHGTAS